ncbi:DUF4156 domain-containing protein [Vibrio cyclitrophicus]|uniref:DUF4156 domain-containing protein n=1 Tax=Vibrio cyclitrophicus TaxID=47951 RepID=UPI0002F5A042|nr:DUF4156 domain-containing protein [Vibrio cyclitrophicus]ERM60168.1 putative outer membrane lipoprotein [Vibrio cyclitrophicus FF75]OED60820.1 hypothetical protein OAU_20155 [Vibrio cyclitrophicus ZF99]OED81517.1 hypothetical protein OAS_18940 [Vibrio cyclitrophicus ZF65]OEE49190.1 hypothetical protein OAG_08070 [Vibrio cyclitrophicus FF75]PME14639.1 hypothetical protein BCV43_16915 [Vibrio cyclitrophicus]
MKKEWVALAMSGTLLGCTTPTSSPHNEADKVQMDFHGLINIEQCEYKGEVTGSEGHWYSYLFFPNDTLIQGAMNELKSNTIELDADTVIFTLPQDFSTSVTMLGTAYLCE